MAKQRPKAEPALRGRHDRYGYPVLRNPLCATSCIKRVTPTSRSRLINVCEEHTSTASSLRLDRPSRPTLVRKCHQDSIAYPFFFPLRFFRCCFAQNLRSDDPRRSAEVDNAVWGEHLTGENVQFMHLDVTRFASHYIASADVLHS